jgi:hypothetical protein
VPRALYTLLARQEAAGRLAAGQSAEQAAPDCVDPPVGQKPLQLLLRRLVRIRSHFQKLIPEAKTEK